MNEQHSFLQRLAIPADADERTIKRAYARELKLIDQYTDIAGLQELREAYEAALYWLRQSAAMQEDEDTAQPFNAGDPDPIGATAGTLAAEAPGPVEAGDGDAEAAAQAAAVFSEFQQRCMAVAPEMQAMDRLRQDLQACLDDTRLVNITARHAFEQHVADLLANGWQPGHHVLLVAATRVFDWEADRRRVGLLGFSGYTLDAAIEQRAMYDLQPDEVCEMQRQLIVRLRDRQQPSTSELITLMPMLATVEARFPTWLALIADADQISKWHELDSKLPRWRRKLKQVKLGVVFPIVVAYFVLLYLLSGEGAPVAPEVQSAEVSAIDKGNELLDAADYPAAIAMFDQALAANPKDSAALGARAMAYAFSDNKESALKDIAQLEVLDAANPRLYRVKGYLAYNDERDVEAIAAFSRAVELAPDNSYSYYMRALSYERKGQLDKALAGADDAIRVDPARESAYSVRARIYKARGDKPKVVEQAMAIVAASSESADAYMTAAKILTQIGEREKAAAVLEQGVRAAATADMHVVLAEVRPPAEVAARRADLKAALLLDPHSFLALISAPELEYEAGQYRDAISAFNAAIADKVTRYHRYSLIAGRAASYSKLGDRVAASSDLKLALSTTSTPAEINNLCWYFAIKNIELQFALDTCNASLAQAPKVSSTLDSKGLVLMRLGRYQEAIASYDAALKGNGTKASSLYVRGIAKHRLGDLKGGKADMDAAIVIHDLIAREFSELGVKL